MWSKEKDGFLLDLGCELVVERVEKVEFPYDIKRKTTSVKFIGTTGGRKAVLHIKNNGEITFLSKPIKRKNNVLDVREEVKKLKGEKLSREEIEAKLKKLSRKI